MEIGNRTSKVRNFENIEGERNANGNQAVKGNFVTKNVVNLSKGNLNYARFLYCRKDLILFQHATIKIKLNLKWNCRLLVECYISKGIFVMKTRIFIAICLNPSISSILVIRMHLYSYNQAV